MSKMTEDKIIISYEKEGSNSSLGVAVFYFGEKNQFNNLYDDYTGHYIDDLYPNATVHVAAKRISEHEYKLVKKESQTKRRVNLSLFQKELDILKNKLQEIAS